VVPPSLLSSTLRSCRLPDPLNRDYVGPYSLNWEAESTSRGLCPECREGVMGSGRAGDSGNANGRSSTQRGASALSAAAVSRDVGCRPRI
jgi:hypothetical protein